MTDKTQGNLRAALEQLAERIDQASGGPLYIDHTASAAIRQLLAAPTPPQEVAGLREALRKLTLAVEQDRNSDFNSEHPAVEQAMKGAYTALAAPTGAAAQPAAPVTTGWPAPALMQDECRELSRALSSKPDAKLHAREVGTAIAKERALQGMTEEAERLWLYEEPSADVRAALAEREFVHAESSRIYARIASVVRAGADDATLARVVRAQVEERASAGEPQAQPDVRYLWAELSGVMADVDAGGFDAVCRRTVERVRDQLLALSQAQPTQAEAQVDALVNEWQSLYRAAINCANGLTNYVEDRPELRRIEREMEAVEAKARAARAKDKTQ